MRTLEQLKGVRVGFLAISRASGLTGGKYRGWMDVVLAVEQNGTIHRGDLHVHVFTDGLEYKDERVGDYRHPLSFADKFALITSQEGGEQLRELIKGYFNLRLPARL